jgi:NADH-quinone oxidoreductase subunit M
LELIFVPLVLGILSFFVHRKWTRLFGLVGSLLSIAVVIIDLCLHYQQLHTGMVHLFDLNESHLPFGLTFSLGYNALSMTFVLLTNAVIFLVILSQWNHAITGERKFVSMTFLMQFSLIGSFIAQDGFLFYLFWEITLIPILLILHWYGSYPKKRILTQFFIITLIGSLAMLFSLMALSTFAPNFNYQTLLDVDLTKFPIAARWIMGGFLLAFAIKIPLVPFHSWQARTYTDGPTAGTMLLSALMLKMALYGMIKWMMPIAFEGLSFWQWPVITLGGIGIVYGAILAIGQKDLKTMFAYASISHLGLIAAGIMLFSVTSLQASMVQIINHSIVAVGLFLAAGIIEQRTGTRNIIRLGGVAKVAPAFGFWFAVITFIALSVPFTAGFIGELLLMKTLFTAHWFIGFVATSTMVFGAIYMFKAYQGTMYGPTYQGSFPDLRWNEWLAFALLTIAAVWFGLKPNSIIDFVQPNIQELHDILNQSKIEK